MQPSPPDGLSSGWTNFYSEQGALGNATNVIAAGGESHIVRVINGLGGS
jgi:hypothetical protein